MKKRVKELLIKKIRSNKSGCRNKSNHRAIVVSLFREGWYKIKNKIHVGLHTYGLLIK